MAELQTISAGLDVAKLAIAAVLLIKKIKNADSTLSHLRNGVLRLRGELQSVETAVASRAKAPLNNEDKETIQRMRLHHGSCLAILKKIEERVGGFDNDKETDILLRYGADQNKSNKQDKTNSSSSLTLIDRLQAVFKHPGTLRLQDELEAQINNLRTGLILLQLSDHAHTHSTLGSNHEEVLAHLHALAERLDEGKDLLTHLETQHHDPPFQESLTSNAGIGESDQNTVISLRRELQIGEKLHDKYTADYQPDDRSERLRWKVEAGSEIHSPSETSIAERHSPIQSMPGRDTVMSSPNESQNVIADSTAAYEVGEVYPCFEMLNRHIVRHRDRSNTARDLDQFKQAEHHLQEAIAYSHIRERRYNVRFENRHLLQEELASLCHKKHEWAEAVRLVSELLRENGDDYSQARQRQLLASIYFDRHSHEPVPLSHTTSDIENARRHAMLAFEARKDVMLDCGPLDDEHKSCIMLLVHILEAEGKGVEARDYATLMTDRQGSIDERLCRRSTFSAPYSAENSQSNEGNTHREFIASIMESDIEEIQSLLKDNQIDVDRPCCRGKTLLIHAVEHSDESTVNRLLDAQVGADVNARNKDGVTALHRAAALGLHGIIACLLRHDAELEAQDNRGETPLIKAIQNDQTTVVELLHTLDANMLTKNEEGWSPLHHAAQEEGIEMINLILDLAPELRHESDKACMTPLHHCVDQELFEQATALLDHRNRVDVNAVDSTEVGRSALYLVAKLPCNAKRKRMVRMLLNHGAVVDRNLPKMDDYADLRPYRTSKKDFKRKDSVSTTGTISTTTTNQSRLSRMFSGLMHTR